MTLSIISNPSPLSNVKLIFSLGGLISVLSKTVKKFIFALYDRGWEALKMFYTGRSRPKVQPLPFHIPFSTEKVPLSYSYIFYQIVPLLFYLFQLRTLKLF